jgi:pimeloyl-ACP methyl ester carboxylesterase
MQETHPRLMVLWGKYDPSFESTEPDAYLRDVPHAEVHTFDDAGHFAIDVKADEIATYVRTFMRGNTSK